MNSAESKSSRETRRRASLKELLLDLANLPDNGLADFNKKWKQLYELYRDEDVLARRDELRLLWVHRLFQLTHRFEDMQDYYSRLAVDEPARTESLHRQWKESHPNAVDLPLTERNRKLYGTWVNVGEELLGPLEQDICNEWLRMKGFHLEVEWGETRKVIVVTGRRLPTSLVQGCLQFGKDFGFCRNPRCPSPYFLSKRHDQLYCSNTCAWPAKKAAKLKWWHENRGKKKPQSRKRRR